MTTATSRAVETDLGMPLAFHESAPLGTSSVRERAYDLAQELATAWDAHPLRKHADVSSAILEPFEKLVALFVETPIADFFRRDWPCISRFAEACQQMALARIDLKRPEAWASHNVRGPLYAFVHGSGCFLEEFDEPETVTKTIESIEQLEEQGVGDAQICLIQSEIDPRFRNAGTVGVPRVLAEYRRRRAAGEDVKSGGQMVVSTGERIPEPDLFPVQTLRKQIRVLNSNAGK